MSTEILIKSPSMNVDSIVKTTLETIFNEKKHQDVLHTLTDNGMYKMWLDDVTEHVIQFTEAKFHPQAITKYIVTRTHAYASMFLEHLEARVGDEVMTEEGL